LIKRYIRKFKMKYIIIHRGLIWELELEVNILIKSGFKPIGGVATELNSRNITSYYQAMIKHEE